MHNVKKMCNVHPFSQYLLSPWNGQPFYHVLQQYQWAKTYLNFALCELEFYKARRTLRSIITDIHKHKSVTIIISVKEVQGAQRIHYSHPAS